MFNLENALHEMQPEDLHLLNQVCYGNLIYGIDDPIHTARWLRKENEGWTDEQIAHDLIGGAVMENHYESRFAQILVHHLMGRAQ